MLHTNEQRLAYSRVMSQVNEACVTCTRVVSHTQMSEMRNEICRTQMNYVSHVTAYCIWSVIESQSPISISLVSFQRTVAKET